MGLRLYGRWRKLTAVQQLITAALVASAVLLALAGGNSRRGGGDGGWAGSYLHDTADQALNERVDASSKEHKYSSCPGDQFRPPGSNKGWAPVARLEAQLSRESAKDEETGEQRFVEAVIKSLPCSAADGAPSCCEHTAFFRPNTTDFKVYQQVFQWHYMRYLYAIFDAQKPKYILDAGANAGFSSTLFKLLWPDAVVVSVEPDPDNFEALVQQTAGLDGVHALNAGLWGRSARIGQVGNHGNWGKVFREKRWYQSGGMQAYSVADIAAMYKIPAFDFVKIDIEGAEGQVFNPRADVAWAAHARVLSLEVHDYFAGYFGLKDVSSRIDRVMSRLPFTVVSDNEHVLYLAKDVVDGLGGGATRDRSQAKGR